MSEPMGLATRWKIWYFLSRTVFRRAYGYHNERVPRGMYDMLYSDKDKFIVIARRSKEAFPSQVATDNLVHWAQRT